MIYEYIYDQTTGYKWNTISKIARDLGINSGDVWSGDNQLDGVWKTIIYTRVELTDQQKVILDSIMIDDGRPPSTQNSIIMIKDIQEFQQEMKTSSGINFEIYYSESVPGSGKFDLIELHFDKNLTNQEKSKLISSYGDLANV